MADYDPTDLIALCASILDDGEVTSEEADDLADWLNKHGEAGRHWPGNELTKPLREIWADGVTSPRELHRLARILISIQRRWAKRLRSEISAVITGESVPEVLPTNLHDVRLPNVTGRYRIPSRSGAGKFYDVDLSGPTCSCPDWLSWRACLPVGHLTRCCKHVFDAYAKFTGGKEVHGWLAAFLDNGWPAHPGAEWHVLTTDLDEVLFCSPSESGWANVYAKEGAQYARFGFNVYEDRWAYGSEPYAALTIADAIMSNRRTQNAS
jgi:hypothetical protein